MLNHKSGEMITFNPKGLTLGNFCYYEDQKTKINILFVTHHTFIDSDTANEEQRDLLLKATMDELEDYYEVISDFEEFKKET
jgi:hypothetical protein